MSEVELLLINSSDSCTMYTIQFLSDDVSEFEKFISKFREEAELNPVFQAIMRFFKQIPATWSMLSPFFGQPIITVKQRSYVHF